MPFLEPLKLAGIRVDVVDISRDWLFKLAFRIKLPATFLLEAMLYIDYDSKNKRRIFMLVVNTVYVYAKKDSKFMLRNTIP